MNAHGAHYVANADAKVQLFSVTSITFHCFFAKQSFRTYKSHFIFKHLHTKSQRTAIFSLFLCNFAVACDCSTTEHATPDINKKKKQEELYSSVFCHTEHSEVSLLYNILRSFTSVQDDKFTNEN